MENQRFILLIALLVIGVLLFLSWEREHLDPIPEQVVDDHRTQSDQPPADWREAQPDAPSAGDGRDLSQSTRQTPQEEPSSAPAPDDSPRVQVRTDLLDVEIAAKGGDLRRVDLLEHGVAADDPTPVRLLRDQGEPFYIARSGLGADGPGRDAVFEIESGEYVLEKGENQLEVPLVWRDNGVEIRKVYTFFRDRYLIDIRHEIRNISGDSWRGFQYVELLRQPDPPGTTPWYIRSFTGGSLFTPEDRFSRISFNEMEENDLRQDVENGWMAMLQHYFLGAIIPQRDVVHRFYTRTLPDETYLIGMSSPWVDVPVGERRSVENRLFIGPKEQARLLAMDEVEGLRLTVDYGWLTVLANPLFWLLDKIHDIVKNWGVAIIIVTLLIKILFYKLSAISYRSMAKMRKVQPKMQLLRERYSDDRQQMNQELMELYKKEKINPLGGCLPILVQIPVFIALYWVLLESVELRHAPFMLWIQDLSSRDPYYILPLLMGATMILQMRLNPPPMDPIQKRVMQVLPFVFTGFFMLFPAGLVLYWLSNNILSIAQQWYVMRQHLGDEKTS